MIMSKQTAGHRKQYATSTQTSFLAILSVQAINPATPPIQDQQLRLSETMHPIQIVPGNCGENC